jgi:hypothetical protein
MACGHVRGRGASWQWRRGVTDAGAGINLPIHASVRDLGFQIWGKNGDDGGASEADIESEAGMICSARYDANRSFVREGL